MTPESGAAPPAGGGALEGAVELLERALAYTRGTLADVRPEHLHRPTPCAGWCLADLLAHMDDALDAFTEAASGYVEVLPPPPTTSRTDSLREKACALLGAWVAARPLEVTIGDAVLDPPILVSAAALEITLHGWDVGRTTGHGGPLPADLAQGLLEIAYLLVDDVDRDPHFAARRPVGADAGAATRLLAWTGRRVTEPPRPNQDVSAARDGLAS